MVSAAVEKSSPQRRFQRVIVALSKNQGVSISGGKGFGSSALKVNGKIFAMLSSRGDFVVKLSRTRVEELVASGKGEYFDPGHSRLMKQWIVVSAEKESWIVFAKQACGFVKKANAAG
ncbi:MAG: MmcQ/YjbR family DNA-binding protein [Gammaproteobacteria bacterium]|nr:MmcQ/YjbR family DNA-binding protein [Gammaproteobacteria bacterium]